MSQPMQQFNIVLDASFSDEKIHALQQYIAEHRLEGVEAIVQYSDAKESGGASLLANIEVVVAIAGGLVGTVSGILNIVKTWWELQEMRAATAQIALEATNPQGEKSRLNLLQDSTEAVDDFVQRIEAAQG